MTNLIYESNKITLKKMNIDIEKDYIKDKVQLTIEKAVNLEDTLCIKYQNKNEYVHSRYCPSTLAGSIYNNMELSEFTVFYGVGLGYELISLLNDSTIQNTLVIIEPNYEIIAEFLERVELKKFTCNYIICANLIQLEACLTNATVHEMENLKFVNTYGYQCVFYDYIVQIADIINQIKADKIFKKRWILDRSRSVFCNTAKNLHHFINGYTLDGLKNIFKDIPGIVVSSGPSLSKNVHLLKQLKGKFLIVCVYSAYKVLLDNNIEPDFVIATDEIQPVLTEHVTNGFNNNLIMTSQLNPLLADACNYNKIWRVTETDGLTKTILKKMKKNIVSIPQGGSVSCSAYSFLEYVGCNPMILVGQDLAFSDNLTHSVGTQGSMSAELDTYSKIYVDSITGTPILTTIQLKYYLDWFVKYISTLPSNIKCINATEGGANILGAENIPLAKVIEHYESIQTNWNIEETINDFINIKRTFSEKEKIEILDFLCESYNNLDKIIEIAKNGQILCQSETNFENIDKVENLLNSFSQTFELIFILYQEVDFYFTEYKCDETLKSTLKRRHLRYSKIIEICEFAKTPLKNAIVDIKRGDTNE